MIIVGAFSYSNFMLFEHRQIIGEGTIHFCGLFLQGKYNVCGEMTSVMMLLIFCCTIFANGQKNAWDTYFVSYARGKKLVFIPHPLRPPLLLLRFRLLAPGTRSSGTRCLPKIAMKDKFEI